LKEDKKTKIGDKEKPSSVVRRCYGKMKCYECTSPYIEMEKDDDEVIGDWLYRWFKCPKCHTRQAFRRKIRV
jgi:hypothetical protein